MGALEENFSEDQSTASAQVAQEIFAKLIQNQPRQDQGEEDQDKGQYVGEVYSISYESALVLIHDHYRKQVGGIPSLSFLIATRLDPKLSINYKKEDSSVLLLRVMDAAPLPNSFEAERVRVETAQRASGESLHWDSEDFMDPHTNSLLSFAGLKCRVIGTFFLDKRSEDSSEDDLVLRFGSDLSNYYPNQGLKVYKPNDRALSLIVNYRDPDRTDIKTNQSVVIGNIRYASTNRPFQGVSDVEVSILPADLLSQKTALFGMTRTGKSNTTKIILQSVFNLRFSKTPLRVGQIVFDPNGEYANENVQDANHKRNPTAIKNLWQANPKGSKEDVITYGILGHPNDLDRKLMLLNFYQDSNLQIGKEIIDNALAKDDAIYIKNFCQITFEKPEFNDRSATTRYERRVLAYRALLHKAGFPIPKTLKSNTQGLFSDELRNGRPNSRTGTQFNGMIDVISDPDNADRFRVAANVFSMPNPSWGALESAFESLSDFMKTTEYRNFNNWYVSERKNASGENWADEDFKKILAMFGQPNGARKIGQVINLHTDKTDTDYADDIYKSLIEGKLIIVDQSSGDPEINDSSARRIIQRIFDGNKQLFREAKTPPDILVYLEEAHNLLPPETEKNTRDIWVRTAKEGAKYNIGMVYTTQEVSSIQKNILKNTSNWLIGALLDLICLTKIVIYGLHFVKCQQIRERSSNLLTRLYIILCKRQTKHTRQGDFLCLAAA